MTFANEASVATLYETLKKEFQSQNPDLKKCGELLTKLKLLLVESDLLLPSAENAGKAKELFIAREVLEIGAYHAISTKDIPAFERYISQLKSFYFDLTHGLTPSQRVFSLLGLNLLRLLADNKIAEFHTELELIEPEQLQNMYIKHPIHIEQCLMEGSYNKIWNARQVVPAPEYLFFVDILMGTIRNSIASCAEKAYDYLPFEDAATLLYFKTNAELLSFAKEAGWLIDSKASKIYFEQSGSLVQEIPANKVIKNTLEYARELERIV